MHRSTIRSRENRDRHLAKLGLISCVACGSTERIEFDHLDPRTKTFDIGWLMQQTNHPALESELALTQPLCRPCHVKKYSIFILPDDTIKAVKDIGRNKKSLDLSEAVWYGFAVGDRMWVYRTPVVRNRLADWLSSRGRLFAEMLRASPLWRQEG